jgi:replicative DNA helicase Mcm
MGIKSTKSLIIDFNDLCSFNLDLARIVLENPSETILDLGAVVHSKLRIKDPLYSETVDRVNIRFRKLPAETPLRKIGADYIGKLIMLNGIIVRASAVTPLIIRAAFKCSSCNQMIYIEQDGQILKKPVKCPYSDCGSRRGFDLVLKDSEFIDSQRVTIQERPEDLPPGQLPRSLDIDLREDLVDNGRPGDRISLTGILDLIQKFGRGGALRTFDLVLNANHLEISGRDMELMELTQEDEAEVLKLSEDPWIHRKLMQSIAPSIYGLESIKEAILYLLFGGVEKELTDVRIRGDINLLLVGDPGTGKSQLIQFASKIAPRGLLTTGRGSTAAGLTAAVVKEGGTGSFVLEAGALVLADKGVCCIDEIDKMREEDRGAIHPAMEQQIVPIAKGGIVATLNARASIIAAANPSLGRYNPYQTIAENINLPITLLSRFDLIFVLRDTPETEKDLIMAEHVLNLHKGEESTVHSPIDPLLLRKYISYSKKIKPKITDDVIKRFKEFYVQMRNASVEGGEASAVSITARQLESLVRLAEARARSELRKEVVVEDTEAVINLVQKYMEQVGIDLSTGELDIDILYTGKPRSLQLQLQKVLKVLSEMERMSGTVSDDELYNILIQDHNINRSEAQRLLSVLLKDGTIYNPRPGYYKRTS